MQKIMDSLGITLSSTCAVHCLFTPIAIILVPLFGVSVLDNEYFHEAILYFILPTALIAITMGCRKHKDYKVAMLAIFGVLVLVGVTVYHDKINNIELWTILGSSILIVSHIRNYVLCQKAGCNHNHH
jgi:cell division protein FtsW (lipid II flippase)